MSQNNNTEQQQAEWQQQQSQKLDEHKIEEGEHQEIAAPSKEANDSLVNLAGNGGSIKANEEDKHERDHSGFSQKSSNPMDSQEADNIFKQPQNEELQLGMQETLQSESDRVVPLKKSKYRARLVGNESRGSNNDLKNNQIKQSQGMKLRAEYEGLHRNKVNHGNIRTHEDDSDKAPIEIHNGNNRQKQNQLDFQLKSNKSDLKEDVDPLDFANGTNPQQKCQQKQLLLTQQQQQHKKQSKKKKLMNNQWQVMAEEKEIVGNGSQGIEGQVNQQSNAIQAQQQEQQHIEQVDVEQPNNNNNQNTNNNINIPQIDNDEDVNAAQGAMMTEEAPIVSDVPVPNLPQNLINPQPSMQQVPQNQFYSQSQLQQSQQQQINLRNQIMQQNGQRLMQMIQRAQAMNLIEQPQNGAAQFNLLQQISQNQQFLLPQLLVAANQQEPSNAQQQLLYPFPNTNSSNNLNLNPLQTLNQAIININQSLPRTQQPGQPQQPQQPQSNLIQQPLDASQDSQLRNQQLRQLANGSAFNMTLSYPNFYTFQQQFSQNPQVAQQQRNQFMQGRQPMTHNLSSYNLSSQNLMPQNGSLEQVDEVDMQQQNLTGGPQTIRSLIHVAVFPGSHDQLGQNPIQPTVQNMQPQQLRQRPAANQLPQDMRNKYYNRQIHQYQDSYCTDQPYMKITAMKTNQDNANNNNVYIVTGNGMVKSKKNTVSEDIIIGRQEMTKIQEGNSTELVEVWPTDIVLPQIDKAISRIHCKLIYKDGFRIRKPVQNEFFLFLCAVKKNKLIIPDVVLRILWSMVRPKCAFYIVDLGSAQGTFIKIRYEKSQIIEKGQIFLIGAETQFQILDVVHSHPQTQTCSPDQSFGENNILPEDLDFLEFLLREKRNNTSIHGLSDEEQQKLDALANQPESDGQNNVTQLINSRKSFRPYVKLKVSSSTVSFHLFVWSQQAVDQGFKIGRSQECTIQININTISRKQSRIYYANGNWQLKDGDMVRESANGTWISLNDYRERNEIRNESDPKEIEDGTEIKISDSILKIEIFNNEPRIQRPKYSFSLEQMEIEQAGGGGNNPNCDSSNLQQNRNNQNLDHEEDESSSSQQDRQDLDVTS